MKWDRRTVARVALGGILAAEVLSSLARLRRRRLAFEAAQARARVLGRPLVVIGNPDAGMANILTGRAYGCGDVCLDLTGCPACGRSFALDLTTGPHRSEVPDDSAVVFVSCVFEYVSDPEAAWREVLRMAGYAENVFLSSVEGWSITAALYPNAKWAVSGDTLYWSHHDACGALPAPAGPAPQRECIVPALQKPTFTPVGARKVAWIATLGGLTAAALIPPGKRRR